MESSILTRFYKQATCPSAERLLEYRNATLRPAARAEISDHLSDCDFCDAELRLLAEHYTDQLEECRSGAIPLNLRYLAEALLTSGTPSMERFAEVTYEKEGLTLTDA